jgi:hypothetical protein
LAQISVQINKPVIDVRDFLRQKSDTQLSVPVNP